MSDVAALLAEVSMRHQRIPLYDGTFGNRCTPPCNALHGATDGPNSPRHVAHVSEMQAAVLDDHIAQQQAAAWERGFAAGWDDRRVERLEHDNPYRKETDRG